MTDHRNGGAAVVETLAAHGVDTVFGIPGTHNLELYRQLSGHGIAAITPRHEQGAGYAAEAYARVTGRPGVVLTTSGPGLTNAMTAAATAYAESQPLLVLSPGVPRGTEGADLGLLHETKDSRGAMDRLVRWSHRATSPEEASAAVAAALGSFGGVRPRPVHVEIPIDVLEESWSGVAATADPAPPPAPDHAAIARAADLLSAARRPIVIAGGGSVDAAQQVRDLAELLDTPVATTVNGKGVLDEAHPLAVGAAIRLRALQEEVAASDVALVVGSELGDSDLWAGRIRAGLVIRCDIDPAQLDKNCPGDVHLLGDAAEVLTALTAAVDSTAAAPATGRARAAALRRACADEARTDAGPYEEINVAVRQALPADAILTGDSSQVTYFGSVHFFDVPGPRQFCYMPGYATLGYGLPAAIGAAVAHPHRPVAALVGDGALMFSVQELVTAVELDLSLPIVVVDNGGYREIRDQQALRGIPPIGVDLRTPDLAAMAIAMGANGIHTTDVSSLSEHVSTALGANRPTLVHLDLRGRSA